jgi:hypothetical protein
MNEPENTTHQIDHVIGIDVSKLRQLPDGGSMRTIRLFASGGGGIQLNIRSNTQVGLVVEDHVIHAGPYEDLSPSNPSLN